MAKYIFIKIFFVIAALVLLMDLSGCRKSSEVEDRLDIAEILMEERPDSSLFILEEIDASKLRKNHVKARYALLKSMALDRNNIAVSTFDVLQPAVDYYLKNGSKDEKLRTFYYKGRIYRNAGDDDHAMQSYLSAMEISQDATDTLAFARLLVAQSTLYYKQYRIKECVENNLRAADLFDKLGLAAQQIRSYCRALNGVVILLNKQKADSIVDICKSIIKNDTTLTFYTLRPLLAYSVNFGQREDIIEIINKVQEEEIADNMKITLARAYSKIGEPSIGLHYLNEVKIGSDEILDSLTYWSVKTEILENLGEDRASLAAFREYSRLLEEYHTQLFSNELLFSEKKHEMEIENMSKIHKRDNIIEWILAGVASLLLFTIMIYYRYRMNKVGRVIAEGNAERLQLETEKLQLERRRLELEHENLHLQVGQLEGEREQLKELLDKHETLSEEARQVVRERIELLNGLFAKAITNEEKYGKEFQKYVDKIKKDKKKFQQSIGKVLEATHPDFMAYLREHDLSEREIDYVCLYAIGLRGKEIGTYLDLARHYNISADVRRKLGLATNSENLGPFLRQLMDKAN